jgi:hypothetical protein
VSVSEDFPRNGAGGKGRPQENRTMNRWFLALAAMLVFTGTAQAAIDPAVVDSLQYTAFRYFWDEANPANGMVRDRSTPSSVASIACVGFGLSAYCVGVEHGWITRDQARTRVLNTLHTFWEGPQGPGTVGIIGYQGLYYHWLDMGTARRASNSELSTIDTALLFAGILHAREFFSSADPADIEIRALADSITWRADWNWARNGSQGIVMQWHPASGFDPNKWVGYNEAMVMYLLAIGSPTHPIPGTDWNWWLSGYNWTNPAGASVGYYVTFPPLFGHQYSHCWIDFRGIQDAYMQFRGSTYFENSRHATLAQIFFARNNGRIEQICPACPQTGESDSLWGFTASDDPVSGYAAHGAPSGFDNGTIAPTAPISSLPFAPDSVWKCIQNMWNHRNSVYDGKIFPFWGKYGFSDAFNPKLHPWFDTAWLGIDQGPIVLMIENWRNGLVWMRTMSNADIQRGLQLAGFTSLPTGVEDPPLAQARDVFLGAEPNPAVGATTLRFRLAREARVRLDVFDAQGRRLVTLVDGLRAPGEHAVTLEGRGLPAGLYLCRFEVGGRAQFRKAILLP